jgi:predicted transposase YbfD/YdcC
MLSASPRRLLRIWRGHWAIENRSHYIRDVPLGEDACRVRNGQAPQLLAAIRNLAWRPAKAAQLVGVPGVQ